MLYISNKIAAMSSSHDAKRSAKGKSSGRKLKKYTVNPDERQRVNDLIMLYENPIRKLEYIRQGMPYAQVESMSIRAELPVKRLLEYLGMPQTTYNKKKREGELLSTRDTEQLLMLSELLEYGIAVFNHEHTAFDNWLRKPNPSLAGHSPESLFDTYTGMKAVRSCLQKIDFGNFA